jgi:outer membrane scaffolding protein for murein synthesis (MipA/OmpV family)
MEADCPCASTDVGSGATLRPMIYRWLPAFAFACVFAGAAAAADANDPQGPGLSLPRWEAGLAAGAGYVPDYPGADHSRTRGIVVPFVVYRGPVLRIDEGGVRGRLVDTTNWEFALSATAAFNAKNNAAREGMPQLDWLGGIGPQWIYKGLATDGGPTLHLKLRALLSTDFKRVDPRGFSLDPEARWRLPRIGGTPAALTLSVQPSWASRELHEYFYHVDPAQATPARPAYTARAGYLGTEFGATLGHRPARDWSWFVTARWMSLHGAANAASPLLRDRSNASLGAGIVWTPWRSQDAGAD